MWGISDLRRQSCPSRRPLSPWSPSQIASQQGCSGSPGPSSTMVTLPRTRVQPAPHGGWAPHLRDTTARDSAGGFTPARSPCAGTSPSIPPFHRLSCPYSESCHPTPHSGARAGSRSFQQGDRKGSGSRLPGRSLRRRRLPTSAPPKAARTDCREPEILSTAHSLNNTAGGGCWLE